MNDNKFSAGCYELLQRHVCSSGASTYLPSAGSTVAETVVLDTNTAVNMCAAASEGYRPQEGEWSNEFGDLVKEYGKGGFMEQMEPVGHFGKDRNTDANGWVLKNMALKQVWSHHMIKDDDHMT